MKKIKIKNYDVEHKGGPKSAHNVKGYLITVFDFSGKGRKRKAISSKKVFRIYHKDKDNTFTDYDIYHYDVFVKIKDKSAEFKRSSDGENILDYSDKVLSGGKEATQLAIRKDKLYNGKK